MIEIIPAILAKNFEDLKEKLTPCVNVVLLVQIDICDGNFVESISWPMHPDDENSIKNILEEKERIPYWDKMDFEFDLMVKNAHKQFDFFIRLGAKKIIFHIEAEDEIEFKEFLESLDPYLKDNIEIGLAINTTTKIDKIDQYINYIDFVQCMGIEKIGFQGQEFDGRVLKQISSLRQKYPELTINVDGGVNENTALTLVKTGANRLVIGSALNESVNIKESINFFENL